MKQKKLVKKVFKKEIPWFDGLLDDEKIALDLSKHGLKVKASKNSMCVYCRMAKLLCGRKRCPLLAKMSYLAKSLVKVKGSRTLDGSSPPSIFVGRYGYPYVYAGPVAPPIVGDTSFYDLPEKWRNIALDEFLELRLSLVRGKELVNVKKAAKKGRLVEAMQELALSSKPVDVELVFKKPVRGTLLLDDSVQPFGPSGLLKDFKVGEVSWHKPLERAVYDYDLKAQEAVLELYMKNVPVSAIQRAFSVGVLGLKRYRRMVPTRWSITAVDSVLSSYLRERVKDFPTISEFRVYVAEVMSSRFVVLLFPSKWKFEFLEAWFPGSAWNAFGRGVGIGGDWEGFKGRTSYASIGGCYYACRLAVSEHLFKIGRQAGALVLRESYPEHSMPVGVWLVREAVREALSRGGLRFETLEEALEHVKRELKVPLNVWISVSKLLQELLYQEKLDKYVSKGRALP